MVYASLPICSGWGVLGGYSSRPPILRRSRPARDVIRYRATPADGCRISYRDGRPDGRDAAPGLVTAQYQPRTGWQQYQPLTRWQQSQLRAWWQPSQPQTGWQQSQPQTGWQQYQPRTWWQQYQFRTRWQQYQSRTGWQPPQFRTGWQQYQPLTRWQQSYLPDLVTAVPTPDRVTAVPVPGPGHSSPSPWTWWQPPQFRIWWQQSCIRTWCQGMFPCSTPGCLPCLHSSTSKMSVTKHLDLNISSTLQLKDVSYGNMLSLNSKACKRGLTHHVGTL